MPNPLHVAVTIVVFGATLTGVLTRPKGVSEAWFAGIGAALMLLVGAVSVADVVSILRDSGNVLLFLLFLMALSALVDTSGFFDWAATLCAKAARGNPRRLLIGVFLLGAAITTLLSLDTTALLLTPLVYAVVARAGLPPRPYLFACAFVANIASSALPVANLTNLLAFNALGVSTAQYALIMTLPTVLSSLTALGIILLLFRRDLREPYDTDAFPDALDAVPHLSYFRVTLAFLMLTLAGYFIGPRFGLPLWAVAAIGSGLLLVSGRALGRVRVRTIATRGIAWAVFPFVIGMFVVIRGVENLGLAAWLGGLLKTVGGTSVAGTVFTSAFGTALGANLINNIPMLLLALAAFRGQGAGALYGAILGCNLGPNVTVVGSLATMLWRSVLGSRGLNVTPGELARAGLAVTLPALLVACLSLWLMLTLVR